MTTLIDENSVKDPLNIEDPNISSYVELLVGEGKKFKDLEALAKGKYYGDIHSRTVEERMDEMRTDMLKLREENNAVPKLQELLERLEDKSISREENQNSNVNTVPAIKPDEVKSLVSDLIKQEKVNDVQKTNYETVENKLMERYGESYKSVLSNQARTLGLSAQEVETMARTNPRLFFKTFDLDAPQSREDFQAPPTSRVRSDNFAPKAEKRGWSYYEAIRKKDPMAYYDPKIAVQMDKDAQAMGWETFRNS